MSDSIRERFTLEKKEGKRLESAQREELGRPPVEGDVAEDDTKA